MAIHQIGNNLVCVAQFLASGAGAAPSLPVSVDVLKIPLASGSPTTLVTGGAATHLILGAFWYRLTSGVDTAALYVFAFSTSGTADQKVVVQGWSAGMEWTERLDATIASRSSHTAADVWLASTRTLSAAGVQAIWDALTSALSTIGSIGKRLVDNIDATISSRMSASSYVAPPSSTSIADQVWDEALAGHLTAGSTGNALNAAGAAGDPWATTLPGPYAGDQAGAVLASIDTHTDLISAGGVTVVSPYNPTTGKLTLTRGDDYPSDHPGHLPPFTSMDWPDLTNAIVRFTIRARVASTGLGGDVLLTMTDTIAARIAGPGEQSITFEPMATAGSPAPNNQEGGTDLLIVGVNTGKWDIQATLEDGTIKTLVTALMDVVEDVTRP